MSHSQIDIEDLYDWLEERDELKEIRAQASGTPCEYRPNETIPGLRLKPEVARELQNDEKGVIDKLWEEVWVPGRKLRGNAYSTPELDASLNSVAKLMSISTLWDFVTTIPLFSYSLSLFSWAAVPAGTLLSFILLIASNYAGHNSTDRRPRHTAKANWSLTAFVLLSVAKTLTSGVGIDLMIGNRAIATEYAQQLAETKLIEDRENYKLQSLPDGNLTSATERCAQLQSQMQELGKNRAANDAQYVSILVQANGTFEDNKSDKSLSTQDLARKYSLTKGVCRYEQALKDLQKEKTAPYLSSIETREKAQKSLPPLKYLEQYEPNIFSEHFRSKGDNIEWVNGSEAVGEATDQFYKKLFAGELGLLGFSLFTFGVAVILTGAASIMLYTTGKNHQVKASFTEDLLDLRNNIVSDYEKQAKKEEI